jgi:hypothetical protein
MPSIGKDPSQDPVASTACALAIRTPRCPGPATASPLLAMPRPLDDALAPPWVFVEPAPLHRCAPDSRSILSHDALADVSPPTLAPARPPFTRCLTALFGARYRAYSRPDAAYRLLQTAFLRRADANPYSSFLAGTEAKTSFLFLRVIAFSLAGAVTRGEPRCVRYAEPRRRFLLVAQVCPTSMPDRPRHLRRAC